MTQIMTSGNSRIVASPVAINGKNAHSVVIEEATTVGWAVTDYATTILAGSAVDPAQRSRVLDQMHRYTGLDKEFLDQAHLRVSAPEYEKELLRDKGLVVGRLDARFTGPTGDALDTRPSHDPQSTAISSAYTSVFNAYLRGELGYDGAFRLKAERHDLARCDSARHQAGPADRSAQA